MDLVGTTCTATAAEQTLAQVFQHFWLKVNITLEDGVRQGDLASGDPPLTFVGDKDRAVRTAGAALDAVLNFFAEFFQFLCFGHIKSEAS